MIRSIYDRVIDLDITEDMKIERLKSEFGITYSEGTLFFHGVPANLKLEFMPRIYLVDDEYIIVKDLKKFRNTHCFNKNGDHLWTIEGCNDPDGKPVEYFGTVIDSIEIDGKKFLQLSSFPTIYITDLATGKGTRILRIDYDLLSKSK